MDEQYEYTPGQLIEVNVAGFHWVSEPERRYVGVRTSGEIVYERGGQLDSLPARHVRPVPVTHEIILTLTDEQVKALAGFGESLTPEMPRSKAVQALIDAAREVLA